MRPRTISVDDLAWCYELIKSCGYSYKQAARMAGCDWQTLKMAIWRAERLGVDKAKERA